MGETVLFGRYRLLEPAGSGGSAQVWRALDVESGEQVAVKRLHPIVFADAAARTRLRREFSALRSLDEPHIVRVRDLQIDGSEAALILDFVAGLSLAERLTAGPPFLPAEAVAITMDVAAALTAAHAAGIVHRDVTPANILLDPNDGARLTDFGIALGAGGGETNVTATGQVMGTLRYLAPEQLRGAAATPASDLHGLAAVTYEMLAGRPAYAAATPVALAEEHGRGPEPIAGVPPGLDALVRRGMATDPADRPPDVATFAAELERTFERQATEPIPMVPAMAVASAGPRPFAATPAEAAPVEHGRRLLPAPLALILALIVAGVVLAALGPPGPQSAARPSEYPALQATTEPTPTATPTPTDTPTPEPTKKDKGKGNDDDDKGKGRGSDGDD
ncbi:MAG TPA: serine/threonine-protein kinase [Candidatus Limnocylindrales bacterium]|nr:serine/threonine-protein kinase [Candidatus Limnocylindrales bacterium]